jgi:hypothetical protein
MLYLCLGTICESILPEHYSKTLVGSVIDQTVFENLVQKHLPQLYKHLKNVGVELSTITVPWFVSLFLNTLPLMCVLRVLDCFFFEGPRFLFMLGLSILKTNEAALLSVKDDDMIMPIFKQFFQCCNERSPGTAIQSEYDSISSSKKSKPIEPKDLYGQELFDYLVLLAYRSFSFITFTVVDELRSRFRLSVVQKMEDSNKRIQLRLLKDSFQGRLSDEELEVVYDIYKDSQFLGNNSTNFDEQHHILTCFEHWVELLGNGETPDKVELSRAVTKSINLSDFRKFMERISPWHSKRELAPAAVTKPPPEESIPLLDRVYAYAYYMPPSGIVNISNVVHVLDIISKHSLSSKVRFFFRLHDADCDGFLNKKELTDAAASLMWLFEGRDNEDGYMHQMSRFLTMSFQSATVAGGANINRRATIADYRTQEGNTTGEYRLSYNNFLLIISSLSEFVQFFERMWDIRINSS